MTMVQYTLTLVMDDAILQSGSNDKLVIAKVVNGAVTNIFTGASPVPAVGFLQLQKSNVFSWADQYQVFGTAAFGKGVFISATTAIKDIDIGQMAEYKNGILNPATKQGDGYFDLKGSFATEGMPLSLHTAVKMSVDGSAFTTIFVDPNAHVTVEKMELQPQNEYYLFWKNEVKTEAMYALNTSKGQKFSFGPGETTKTLRFGYATADAPVTALEVPQWY